jgi:hypothetical protein
MPEKRTLQRARKDAAEGKSPSTQAGEFVRQEMEHIRHGKHGARSTKQAIAIGLSEARRAGVKVKPPGRGVSAATRRKAKQDARRRAGRPSSRRSSPTKIALRRKRRSAAKRRTLSRQARAAAKRRSPAARHATAMKAVHRAKSRGR